MKIEQAINQLIAYGYDTGLLDPLDQDYAINRLRNLLGVKDFVFEEVDVRHKAIHEILMPFIDYALEKGMITETIDERDNFDTQVMDCITPPPSHVIGEFGWEIEHNGVKDATDYFYDFNKASNYIRVDRIEKDKKWAVETPYGQMEMTINLSKPEKDPRTIALAQTMVSSSYPKCLLCKEHVGNNGSLTTPPRNNHRVIPLTLNNEEWVFQYSPYVYYNEHCIVIRDAHIPMKISRETFVRLLEFVQDFRHYFIGSNAGLPIVGGSILDHEHYQGGRHIFAMDKAEVIKSFTLNKGREISVDVLKWPLTTLRLRRVYEEAEDLLAMVNAATHVLEVWRGHSDPACEIHAFTGDTPHNTITPIARYNKETNELELDITLRNNRTSEAHPDGIFHPHAHLHHLKKENIGLIEVMGLAVLPGRLVQELEEVKTALLRGDHKNLGKHGAWVQELLSEYPTITETNVQSIIETAIGQKFTEILECCGVYKQTSTGLAGLDRLIQKL